MKAWAWQSVVASVLFASVPVTAQDVLKAKVDQVVKPELTAGGFGAVVGIIRGDERRVFGYGTVSADSKEAPDGDTVFEIGSITKTFTSLILADMVQEKRVGYDDPVQRYVPKNWRVPARGGKEITLLNLATHVSGLPRIPPELALYALGSDNPYKKYTPAVLREFLSKYELPRDIGAKHEYSNLGVGLLGYALSRRAGCSYEELVVGRVCEPLGMHDTRITLSPEMKRRVAQGYSEPGEKQVLWDFDVLAGAGALRSTANDMLRYVGAQMDPPKTRLGAAIKETHVVRVKKTDIPYHGQALGWLAIQSDDGKHDGYWHNGGTGGHEAFAGFWGEERVGVVVFRNCGGLEQAATKLGLDLMVALSGPAVSSAPASSRAAGE